MSSGEESVDDEIENDLEIIEEGGETIQEGEEVPENLIEQVEVNNEEANELTTENREETATDNKTVVKPKRIIQNPQPKLNEQTLQGPKGLSSVHSYFERVKFKGRGYEEHDLNTIMKTYEHWCHRLFPKFPFDDCIGRLEKLGTKRGTQTQIKKIRMGLELLDPEKPIVSDEEENHEEEDHEQENHTGGFVDTYNDQFDQLLPSTSNQPQPEITEDQMERIRQNKERAQKLREERLRKIKEKAQNSLGQSDGTNTQSSQLSTKNSHPDNLAGNNSQSDNENHLGNEDNIENILGFINAEEKSGTKNQNNVLESDSEDEIVNKISKDTVRNVNVRRHILESDEDEDIENILTEVNIDNSVVIASETRNPPNEERDNSSIHFLDKAQNMQTDSNKQNSNENILREMPIDNEQNTKSVKSKLSVTRKAKEFITSLDNSNRLMIQNGNAVSNSINEAEVEEDDMENMEEEDMENILSEINSDADICVPASALKNEGKGNKTLHINESDEIDNNLAQNKEIVKVFNSSFQESNTARQGGSSNHSEDAIVNCAGVQNQAQAAEIDKEEHIIENSLSSTMTSNNSPQADNTNVQIDAVENTVSNKDKTKGTEYVSRENEEWMKALNNINPQVTVNANKQVILDEPMDID